MRFKGTLVLLVAALIAGSAYVFYVVPHGKEKKMIEELSSRFFRIDGEKVEFLRIRNSRGVFDMERKKGQWDIKSPRALPADSVVIGKITGLINRGGIVKIISDNPVDMADYGLEKPQFILSLGYEGKIDELALGSVNPAGTGVYAFAKGIRAVFLVDKEMVKVLDAGLYELRSKSLFNFDQGAITGIKILRGKDEIEIAKEKGAWAVVRPVPGRASDDAVKKYLSDILNQRAEEIYDGRAPGAADYPRTIRVLLQSGEGGVVEIDVHYWGTRAREGVVAHQKGMAYSGRLAREFWDVVNRDASYFRYRNLFQFDELEIVRIRVSRGNARYELVRKGATWRIDDKRVDEKDAMKFVWFLKEWNAARLLGPQAVFQKGAPTLEIALEDGSGRNMGSLKVYGKTGEGPAGYSSEGPVELYYALSDNLQRPCIVSSSDFNGVPRKGDLAR